MSARENRGPRRITEIQGPYYTPMDRRSFEDIADTKHYA
jgi:hypothetical protein